MYLSLPVLNAVKSQKYCYFKFKKVNVCNLNRQKKGNKWTFSEFGISKCLHNCHFEQHVNGQQDGDVCGVDDVGTINKTAQETQLILTWTDIASQHLSNGPQHLQHTENISNETNFLAQSSLQTFPFRQTETLKKTNCSVGMYYISVVQNIFHSS